MANISKNFPIVVSRLKDIANATRGKTGGTELLYLHEIDDEIDSVDIEDHVPYEGKLEVTPSFYPTTLPTGGTALDEDITVKPIVVTTVGNVGGGNTLII